MISNTQSLNVYSYNDEIKQFDNIYLSPIPVVVQCSQCNINLYLF